MITKRTDELEPNDVVVIFGHRRTVASVESSPHVPDLLRVKYEPISEAAGTGGWAEVDDMWQVDAPSPLDLAVARARELVNKYPPGAPWRWSVALSDFRELMDLFRAAR